jgi:hypothetical protein
MEEGRVRAYGPAAEIAERYMNEVNLDAIASQHTLLQTHRGGTGEVRYLSAELVDSTGRQTTSIPSESALIVRATYRVDGSVVSPVFQFAIVDVDTGVVVTTASSSIDDMPIEIAGTGAVECRFARLPLRPRQYVLRLSITDAHQVVPYDVLSAGPRFAVTGFRPSDRLLGGEDSCPDGQEEDGLVSLPFEFTHRASTLKVVNRS